MACPETKEAVSLASAETLAALNDKISAGGMKNRGGQEVKEAVTAGLLRADGKYLYVIRDGIPVMLIDEALPFG